MSPDPYADPLTGILRNKLGITEANQLQRIERRLTRAALIRLAEQPLPGRHDLVHLQAFHFAIFRDIYPWAGQIRTVNIAKTELLALYPYIESSADQTFRQLAAEGHLRDFPFDRFVERLVHYYAEVNAIHPFREGNGRAQRGFFGQMAFAAGWRIGWERLKPEMNVAASVASLRGDNQHLGAMFRALVDPA